MHLVKADEIVCEYNIGLEEFLKIAGNILRNGGIDKTIVINSHGKVIENLDICVALKKLGVKYIPVSYNVAEVIFVPLETLKFFDEIDPSRYRVFKDSEELLYKNWPTPLVRLRKSSIDDKVAWAKLEGFNPWSMSVKDRIGWYMYRKAIERYCANKLHLLVESTSTNTGLAITSMCSIYGSRLRAYIPSTVSITGELLLKIFGADVVRSPKPLTVDLIDEVEDVAKKEGVVHLNQFYNDANLEVHLRYTAKELELQIREAGIVPKAIFGGLGTSGHMSAISIYFKNRFRGVKIYGVVPKPGTSIQGIRRIESGMKWLHHVEIDEVIEVSPEEAIKGVLDVVRNDGIFIGLSSGAVYYVYRKMAIDGKIDKGDYILIFPDIGFKYIEQISKYIQ
jgi:cysteine synthase/O-phosphoserine sulfhydrylase/cystathionine beta-synthase